MQKARLSDFIFFPCKPTANVSAVINQAFYKNQCISTAMVVLSLIKLPWPYPLSMDFSACHVMFVNNLHVLWCCFHCFSSNKLILIWPTNITNPALKLWSICMMKQQHQGLNVIWQRSFIISFHLSLTTIVAHQLECEVN